MTQEARDTTDAVKLELVEHHTSGARPLEIQKKVKPPKGDRVEQSSNKPSDDGPNKKASKPPKPKTKMVKLRCQEGKNGYLCMLQTHCDPISNQVC